MTLELYDVYKHNKKSWGTNKMAESNERHRHENIELMNMRSAMQLLHEEDVGNVSNNINCSHTK